MADFENTRKGRQQSLGDTEAGTSLSLVERTKRLVEAKKAEHTKVELEKAAQEQDSVEATNDLSGINRVIGNPKDEFVDRNFMDPAPDEWNCFPRATEEAIERMAASIRTYGLLHRVSVWKRQNGRYMILGGHTRTACYDYLYGLTNEQQYKYVPCLVYDSEQLTETDAHRIFLSSNTDQRTMSASVISKAYFDLISLEKKQAFYGSGIYARNAAAEQANVSVGLFSRYLKLRDLVPGLAKEVDNGNVSVKTGYFLAFLSERLQDYIYDHELYIDMTHNTAQKVRDEAKTEDDIDRILADNKTRPVHSYTVKVPFEKPRDYDILPILLPKDADKRRRMFRLLGQAISKSDLDQEVKDMMAGIFPVK